MSVTANQNSSKAAEQEGSSYLKQLWSINMKLAVSAYSHAIDIVASCFLGNYALLGCLAPSSLPAAIFVSVAVASDEEF